VRLAEDAPGGQVFRQAVGDRHPRPGGEHAQDGRAEIRRHPDQVAHVKQLALPVLGNRAAEVVVRGNGVDLDPRVVRAGTQLGATRLRHVGRVTVRPLAVDFDALVAEALRPPDDLFDRQRRPAVPETEIRDAVEPDLHGGIIADSQLPPRTKETKRSGG
jgi:hypothetical protein